MSLRYKILFGRNIAQWMPEGEAERLQTPFPDQYLAAFGANFKTVDDVEHELKWMDTGLGGHKYLLRTDNPVVSRDTIVDIASTIQPYMNRCDRVMQSLFGVQGVKTIDGWNNYVRNSFAAPTKFTQQHANSLVDTLESNFFDVKFSYVEFSSLPGNMMPPREELDVVYPRS